MVRNRLNASPFSESSIFYKEEFEGILQKITHCYKMMINDGVKVCNREEKIRDCFYSRYLSKNEVRNSIGLNYDIDCEPAVYDKKDKLSGYVDIKIFSHNSLRDTSAYYIIECKRLTGKSGLNTKYIEEGVMRFVKKDKYLTNKGINGMIGFVVAEMNIAANIENINLLLSDKFACANTKMKLSAVKFIEKFNYQYQSRHRCCDNKLITLYHLMFDFSKNMN